MTILSASSLKDHIISLAQRELNTGVIERDRNQEFSQEQWTKCGELRLQGLVSPAECGGPDLAPEQVVDALEALGYACTDGGLCFAIGAHLLSCVVPICRHGSDVQKREYLPAMSDGSLIAANAMTEPDCGSDVFAMATTARRDGDGYILNGRKTFVSNAPVAGLILVYAATDSAKGFHGGVSAFLVPVDLPGVRVGTRVDKMSLRTCPMSDVVLDSVRVDSRCMLGRAGAGGPIFAESMEWEKIGLSAIHVGAMQRLLEGSVAHARHRKSRGEPIGRHQAVAHRLADMKVRLEAARIATRQAATLLGKSREAGLQAAVVKLLVSESLLASAIEAVRTMGGYGIMESEDTQRTLRDAIAATIYSGTSDIQRNIIASWLGL